MTLQQRERIGSIIRSVVVIAIALICAVPLYVIVINTFKSSAEMSMDPIGYQRHGISRTTRMHSGICPLSTPSRTPSS